MQKTLKKQGAFHKWKYSKNGGPFERDFYIRKETGLDSRVSQDSPEEKEAVGEEWID